MLLAAFVTTVNSDPVTPPPPVASAPLNAQWRAVLRGEAARQLIKTCGPLDGLTDASWEPIDADLNRLDRKLLPRLTADLKSAGASRLPQEYYRQYAAADWQDKQVVYVNGFHQSLFQKHASSWMSKPVTVRKDGPDSWCAIYIKNTAHFVAFEEKGRAPRSISFHHGD